MPFVTLEKHYQMIRPGTESGIPMAANGLWKRTLQFLDIGLRVLPRPDGAVQGHKSQPWYLVSRKEVIQQTSSLRLYEYLLENRDSSSALHASDWISIETILPNIKVEWRQSDVCEMDERSHDYQVSERSPRISGKGNALTFGEVKTMRIIRPINVVTVKYCPLEMIQIMHNIFFYLPW